MTSRQRKTCEAIKVVLLDLCGELANREGARRKQGYLRMNDELCGIFALQLCDLVEALDSRGEKSSADSLEGRVTS